jgi:hypothetical protein
MEILIELPKIWHGEPIKVLIISLAYSSLVLSFSL